MRGRAVGVRGVCCRRTSTCEVTSRVRVPVRYPAPVPACGTVPGRSREPRPAARRPERGPRVRAPARRQGGAADRRSATTVRAARRAAPDREVNTGHGRRHHAAAAGQRRALRAPDPALEPEDEALHLHRAQRHLHHRPAAVAVLHRPRLRVRQGDRRPRRHDPVRRHQEAGAGGHRRAGDPGRHAVREPALAGRHAHQLLDRLQAAAAPQGARGDRLRDVAASGRTKKEILMLTREKDKLEKTLGGIRDMAEGARARSGSWTPRRSTSPSARPASWASRSSRSSTPTATPTRSTTRSRATTTRSAPSRCSPA